MTRGRFRSTEDKILLELLSWLLPSRNAVMTLHLISETELYRSNAINGHSPSNAKHNNRKLLCARNKPSATKNGKKNIIEGQLITR